MNTNSLTYENTIKWVMTKLKMWDISKKDSHFTKMSSKDERDIIKIYRDFEKRKKAKEVNFRELFKTQI